MSKAKKKWFDWDKIMKDQGKDEDDDLGYSYDYGFSKPLNTDGHQKIKQARSKDDLISAAKDLESTPWSEYESTGHWRGYYVQPKLDTMYIKQMANMLAARYKIDVKAGDAWYVDVNKKQLTYDPRTLIYGTKGNLIVCLLHEMGHIRYTTPTSKIQSSYVKKYPQSAHHVINVFEDMRIDTIMAKSYGSAEEIYESNKDVVKQLAKKYEDYDLHVKASIKQQLASILIDCRIERQMYGLQKYKFSASDVRTDERRKHFFQTDDPKKIAEALDKFYEEIEGKATYFEYVSTILLHGYGEKVAILKDDLQRRIDLTFPTTLEVKTDKNTQALVTRLDNQVYPVIEDLMKENEEGLKALQELFGGGGQGEQQAKNLMDQAHYEANGASSQGRKTPVNQTPNGKKGIDDRMGMTSGPGQDEIKKEWLDGEYPPIKKDVQNEITRLTRILQKIKVKDNAVRWEQYQKRGKISTKQVFNFAKGGNRIFKRRHEVVDRIAKYAFTMFVDTSGSMMEQNKSVHTMRGVVVFAEVFETLGIPFEVLTFDYSARTVKAFDQKLDDKIKKKIAGLAESHGGSTNLIPAFNASKIQALKKQNKFCIILSDGQAESPDYIEPYINAAERKNVKVMGVSLNSGPDLIRLCRGRGIEVNSFGRLPEEFETLLKSIIKKI